MLRISSKNKIIAMLRKLINKHHSCGHLKGNARIDFFAQCQQEAIDIGAEIEGAVSDEKEMIGVLEQYCEEMYKAGEDGENTDDDAWKDRADALLEQVIAMLSRRNAVYQAVFFPYKASMWDSLESIWMAYRDDPDVETLVIPIPYYQYDRERNTLAECYEGAEEIYRYARICSVLCDIGICRAGLHEASCLLSYGLHDNPV